MGFSGAAARCHTRGDGKSYPCGLKKIDGMVLLRAEAQPASLSAPGLMGLSAAARRRRLRVRARDAKGW